jgi:hypothetical protein
MRTSLRAPFSGPYETIDPADVDYRKLAAHAHRLRKRYRARLLRRLLRAVVRAGGSLLRWDPPPLGGLSSCEARRREHFRMTGL